MGMAQQQQAAEDHDASEDVIQQASPPRLAATSPGHGGHEENHYRPKLMLQQLGISRHAPEADTPQQPDLRVTRQADKDAEQNQEPWPGPRREFFQSSTHALHEPAKPKQANRHTRPVVCELRVPQIIECAIRSSVE